MECPSHDLIASIWVMSSDKMAYLQHMTNMNNTKESIRKRKTTRMPKAAIFKVIMTEHLSVARFINNVVDWQKPDSTPADLSKDCQ